MHLTEEPPLPKGYPRTSITKAQREELLEELRRRYRERKAQMTLHSILNGQLRRRKL